jgi:hypothetical protein
VWSSKDSMVAAILAKMKLQNHDQSTGVCMFH